MRAMDGRSYLQVYSWRSDGFIILSAAPMHRLLIRAGNINLNANQLTDQKL